MKARLKSYIICSNSSSRGFLPTPLVLQLLDQEGPLLDWRGLKYKGALNPNHPKSTSLRTFSNQQSKVRSSRNFLICADCRNANMARYNHKQQLHNDSAPFSRGTFNRSYCTHSSTYFCKWQFQAKRRIIQILLAALKSGGYCYFWYQYSTSHHYIPEQMYSFARSPAGPRGNDTRLASGSSITPIPLLVRDPP